MAEEEQQLIKCLILGGYPAAHTKWAAGYHADTKDLNGPFLFLVSVRSAKTSAIKIKKVKILFIYSVKYGTKISAKISANTFDVFMCNYLRVFV